MTEDKKKRWGGPRPGSGRKPDGEPGERRELRKRLVSYREKQNWKRSRMADLFGVKYRTYYAWETGSEKYLPPMRIAPVLSELEKGDEKP